MYELSIQLEQFFKEKKHHDPLYHKLMSIYVSDSNAPGEGEQKIYNYIRNLQISSDYKNNSSYCIFSDDADCIILSLLTHENNFAIIKGN